MLKMLMLSKCFVTFLLQQGNLSKLTPRKFLSESLENEIQIPFNLV